MKTIEEFIKEFNQRKVPVVRINESLNKYTNVVLFPEKLAKANEMIRGLKLPEVEKPLEETKK
jgi:hypothetical protein